MLDLTQKTYQNLLKAMLERVPDIYDKRDAMPIPTALGPAAYALEDFYLLLNKVQQAGFIQTAVGQSLDDLAAIGGISRYPASPAVRLGLFDAAVPIGARFSTIGGADSVNFTVTAAADEADRYQLTAETPGTGGNQYAGPLLPITAIPGLNSAQMTAILIPGDDEETDDALRTRLITALNDRPFGGNVAAYRENISAVDGVGAVQVYPTWNGGGTVKCVILGADWRAASAQLVQTVQNAMDPPPNQGQGLGLAPIGAQVTISAPEEVTVNVSAALTLASGYALEQVQEGAQEAVAAYLLTVRQGWGTPETTGGVTYSAPVYLSRVTAALLSVPGVVNAANVLLNGEAADLVLTQTGETQEIPVLGTVTLHG